MVTFFVAGRQERAQAFLFDKDGTLISFSHWAQVMRWRAGKLARKLRLSPQQEGALLRLMGVDPHTGEALPGGLILLPRVEVEAGVSRFLTGLGVAAAEELVAHTFHEVDEEFPFQEFLEPTPGAGELLSGIKRAGGRVGVVTHDAVIPAQKHLAALGWEELVDVVVGADSCRERKPHPAGVLQACRALGVSPQQVVMVGDTAADLAAGRAAGCRLTLGVLTGAETRETLTPVADHVLTDLREIRVS